MFLKGNILSNLVTALRHKILCLKLLLLLLLVVVVVFFLSLSFFFFYKSPSLQKLDLGVQYLP